jgi:hypothetical protein
MTSLILILTKVGKLRNITRIAAMDEKNLGKNSLLLATKIKLRMGGNIMSGGHLLMIKLGLSKILLFKTHHKDNFVVV